MGINQIEKLNQRRLKKRQEVEIFLNNLNTVSKDRAFHFDIKNIELELTGLIDKFQRDTINISILSEVSSGKSTFLNALVFGESILESTIGETTAKIFNIRYGKKFSINGEEKESLLALKKQISIENHKNLESINNNENINNLQSIITLPNENLKRGIELYDTPGFATINESAILPLLKDTISKSDATILLLDISQGIKKSEYHFIENMIPRIQNNKRFIVLNKYDTLIDEENLILKSKEQIDSELKNLIHNIESKLQLLQKEPNKKIDTYHLSAKKALVSKIENDTVKFEESRFGLFEKDFWSRVITAKGEIFEDNIKIFDSLKEEIKEYLKKEKEILLEKQKTLQFQLRASLDDQEKIATVEKNIAKIEALNSRDLQKKSQERVVALEHKVVEDILNMLKINLASELEDIHFINRVFFWRLKNKYKKNIISVIKEARSFIIKHLEFFIVESTKKERIKDAIILEINRDLNILFSLEKYEKRVDLEDSINRVIKRVKGYVKWNSFMLIGLLKYNLFTQKEPQLEPSFIELTNEIATIKRDLNNIIINSKIELDEYIVSANQKVQEMKNSLKNQDNLEIKIDEISSSIKDIELFLEK